MTAPVVTPRAEIIAEDLLRDARAFLAEQGAELASRQVEALARAVARHLAALEDLMLCGWPQREEALRAGTATGPLPTKPCTCASPRSGPGTECRGAATLGVGWHCAKTGERGRAEALPTPLRDAALGLEEPPPTPAPPPMKIVQRWDREAPESVPESEIRWAMVDEKTLHWSLLDERPHYADPYSYIRKSPDSPWGVRVDVLGEGR